MIVGAALGTLLRCAATVALVAASAIPAAAQVGALLNCSQTVGTGAAAVPFPTSGTGPGMPSVYLEICDAHASQTLGVNPVGGTASIGAAGTLTLSPGGCMWWNTGPIPSALSVIGSGASTTTMCSYK